MVQKSDYKFLQGDALSVLKGMPDKSVQCCVTSPPYYGLRDYGTGTWIGGDPNCPHYRTSKYSENDITGHKAMGEQGQAVGDAIYKSVCPLCGATRVDEQIGIEETPEEYVERLVEVFREVKRVLKDDGTLWVNIGDTYNTNSFHKTKTAKGCKPKDLIGVPWKLAEALKSPYYTGVIKNEADRAWLAAMMDGEGSFVLSSYNSKGRIKTNFYIMLTNSSEKIIGKCESLFPQKVRHIYEKPSVTRKAVYRWDVEKLENKELFIREIYPYMVEKRKQCIVGYTFLQLQKGMPNKKHGYTKDQQEKRQELVEIMHKLNAGQDVDLPSYCQEPNPLYEQMFYLRQDIIWDRPNPMPESVKDRCTKAHEYVFLLSKSPTYLFNHEKMLEPANYDGRNDTVMKGSIKYKDSEYLQNGKTNTMSYKGHERWDFKVIDGYEEALPVRNRRDVWHIPVSSYSGAHFATYPEELVMPCILAGTNEGDTVLDPFNGSGTTGVVALKNGRKYVGIDLNSEYIKLSEERFDEVFFDKKPLVETKKDERYERRFRGLDI